MSIPHPAAQIDNSAHSEQMSRRSRVREVAGLFTRLGFTAFGGPAAHLALIEDEAVARRRWIDREHFLDIVAAINFIPGPNSTELAIHLGQLRAGFAGLVVAGVCFITPAVLIILPIAWLYVSYGTLPQVEPMLRAIGAAVVAIVAMATIRFLQTALKDAFTIMLCALVTVGAAALQRFTHLQPEIIALAFAALCGGVWYARPPRVMPMLGVAPAYVIAVAFPREFVQMSLFFLKIGATLFGSGYVLVSYLQSGLVHDYNWMSERQLLDAIAVGQFTPGPLLTTATFVGFFLGHTTFAQGIPGGMIGAILATVAIFLPSFIFVAIFGPLLQKLRRSRIARGALDGMNAAVVGLMIVVTVRLAGAALFISPGYRMDWLNLLILAGAGVALWWKINATWLILAAGAMGWLFSALG